MRPGVARPETTFLERLHQMLGDDAIPACGWCEDGITLWFDWLAMDAYDNRNWGPALEHVVFASMVISQLQQLSNPTRRAFYI